MIGELAPLLLFGIVLLSVGCGYIYFVLTKSHQSEAKKHLSELQYNWAGEKEAHPQVRSDLKSLSSLNGEYAKAGLFDSQQIATFKLAQMKAIAIGTLFFFMLCFGLLMPTFKGAFLGITLGVSLSYLFSRRMLATCAKQFHQDLIFFLPVVMERLVMAVQAGIDIVPAIQTVVALEETKGESQSLHPLLPQATIDPVTRLLRIVSRLCDAGLPFETALKEITQRVDSTPVKHAFVHLAVAHKEGGELVGPLRELSDATQLYYQENVEEQIAVMPVKATAPLLVTFAGLLIIFITSPILQVGKFTKSAMPGQNRAVLSAKP